MSHNLEVVQQLDIRTFQNMTCSASNFTLSKPVDETNNRQTGS